MTNDTRKPREFWLVINREEPAASFECLAYAAEPTHGAVKHLVTHVIEYSAYEALKKNQTAYRTFEAIAGDCKEKADMQDEIDALRKERDELKYKLHFMTIGRDANLKAVGLLTKERDEYRAALEKIVNRQYDCRHPILFQLTIESIIKEVLAKYPKAKE